MLPPADALLLRVAPAPADFLVAVPLAFLLAVAVVLLVAVLPAAALRAEPVFAPAPEVLPSFLAALLLVFADEPAPLLLLAVAPLVAVLVLLLARAEVAEPDFFPVVPAALVVPAFAAPPVLFLAVAVPLALVEEAPVLEAEEVDFAPEDLLPEALFKEDAEEERVAVAVALFALPEPAVFFFVSFSLVLVDFVAI